MSLAFSSLILFLIFHTGQVQRWRRPFFRICAVAHIVAPAVSACPLSSDRAARVDFAGPAWTHQVIIDGLHDQARIFDRAGRLVGRSLGLYVRPERAASKGEAKGAKPPVVKTRVTAALPLALLGDPDRGEWAFYVLVGLADSTHPSLMRHAGSEGRLEFFSGALADGARQDTAVRPDIGNDRATGRASADLRWPRASPA